MTLLVEAAIERMNVDQIHRITDRYPSLKIAVLGDFCLDRYLEIDPARAEISIETNLEVHNVVRVRSQPGGAGTILNNLAALDVGTLYPIGFAGIDGEGFELRRALAALPGVRLDHFLETGQRRTFTYCKPLVLEPGKPPRELNRLDSKNWTATPEELQDRLSRSVETLIPNLDALIVLDQVDVAETGVVTARVLEAVQQGQSAHPKPWILADSRRGLEKFPPVCFKMNRAELSRLSGSASLLELDDVRLTALKWARRNGRPVFVSLAEEGLLAADPTGSVVHRPALPLRGPIDIVGAGDAVTANVAAALAGGATLEEAVALALAAASIVIHQLGTTGTAARKQVVKVVGGEQ